MTLVIGIAAGIGIVFGAAFLVALGRPDVFDRGAWREKHR